MPGDGGVCGVVVEVLLGVVVFAGVEAGVEGGAIVLAVVLAGAAGVEVLVDVLVGAAGVEAVVEVLVEEAGVEVVVFAPVAVEVPDVPPVDLLDLDFEDLLFEVEVLLEVELLDEVEVLEDPAGACDLSSFEETTPISSASKTGEIPLFRKGKVITLQLLSSGSALAVFV